MPNDPRALMIFAAGFGTRMGALTRDRPKPLIGVAGRPLIDHAIAMAQRAGIRRIVANAHYLGDMVEAHLAPLGIPVSREVSRILDTGGGLRRALPLLGPGAVMTLNPDVIWTGGNPFDELRASWSPDGMDALLLLGEVPGRRGDFTRLPDGQITRGGALTYLGAQIMNPAVLGEIADEAFSLNKAWDILATRGRLFGALHSGSWCDVGTPEGIAEAEDLLAGV